MSENAWSVEEEELLKKVYGTMSSAELVYKYFPNKSYETIKGKAKQFGLTVWEVWDEETLKILKENSVPVKIIAKVLNRSEASVQKKAGTLGYKANLTKVFNDDSYLELQNELLKLDTKLVGTINEELVKIKLATEGFDIFVPFMSNHKADLVILQGRTSIRVQVKSARYESKYKCFHGMLNTKKRGKIVEYKDDEVDFFIVKCNGIEEYYVIPYAVSKECSSNILLYPHRHKLAHKMDVDLEDYRNAFNLITEFTKINLMK